MSRRSGGRGKSTSPPIYDRVRGGIRQDEFTIIKVKRLYQIFELPVSSSLLGSIENVRAKEHQ